MNFKQILSKNLINLPGWHTNRKIVVIESDDWGSIRMPSKDIYNQFLKEGIRVDKDPYCTYDCLATKDDLSALFEVLTSVKDKNGNHAVLTANTVVANPDFDKINASGFREYYYEPFTETLKKSPLHTDAFSLWQEGINWSIFYPQFHGREHLNIKKWLSVLQKGDDTVTRQAFDLNTFGLTENVSSKIENNYMGAFDSARKEDIIEYDAAIKEGLDLFEQLFGFRSESFIATTYTWSPDIEVSLKKNGIKYLQGMVSQRIPLDGGYKFKYKNTNFCGAKSKSGLKYLMRNCFFEPSQNRIFDWTNDCLRRVQIAFQWHKPAIISMHRLNVIGAIDQDNRNQNLKLLKNLLEKIVLKWPDVEFMSSDQLGNLIEGR